MFAYAGITKVIDPNWSAGGYIKGAKTFPWFYDMFLGDNILPVISFLNKWGLLLVGISLLVGLCVRLSSYFGALLMALYYFPILAFPYVGVRSYLVDEHVMYFFVMVVFISFDAGLTYGLKHWLIKKQFITDGSWAMKLL